VLQVEPREPEAGQRERVGLREPAERRLHRDAAAVPDRRDDARDDGIPGEQDAIAGQVDAG